jgi:uncharacterized protein (TIGR00297 family)
MAILMWQRQAAWIPLAFLGAIATVTADTWATELGTLSPRAPRLVTTGQPVPPGTNGAVSLLGTLAALVGGLVIGTAAFALAQVGALSSVTVGALWLPFIATLSGLAGAYVDSLLGATVQHTRYCPRCETETERDPHHCGIATHELRGWRWMDNDMVNFTASVAGSVVAAWLSVLLV